MIFPTSPSLLHKEIFRHPCPPLAKRGSLILSQALSFFKKERDVAGSTIAPPEFWYRKRSLCPKGLAMIFYATELRLFVRCYTALLRACLEGRSC